MKFLRCVHAESILRTRFSFQRTIMAKSTSAKPTVWLHGPIDEDVLVGFRKEQMQMIREHFNVVTYKQFKESGISNPSIVGMYICMFVYFFKKSKVFAGLIIGRCKGVVRYPISYIFMQFSVKFFPSNRFLAKFRGLRPPAWVILDPPLVMPQYACYTCYTITP